MTLTMFMTYLHAKVQGQRSVGSKGREYTNGQMDGGECITGLVNVVRDLASVFEWGDEMPKASRE